MEIKIVYKDSSSKTIHEVSHMYRDGNFFVFVDWCNRPLAYVEQEIVAAIYFDEDEEDEEICSVDGKVGYSFTWLSSFANLPPKNRVELEVMIKDYLADYEEGTLE